jgi:peptidase E
MPKHILAHGGGGFDIPFLRYCCQLVEKPLKEVKLCYLPTASGDDGHLIENFYAELEGMVILSHVQLIRRSHVEPQLTIPDNLNAKVAKEILAERKQAVDDQLRTKLISQDVIYVGGGNTLNLLKIWDAHGVSEILRECYDNGVILCGSSAGALCWFAGGLTDSFGPILPLHEGLKFLPYSCCPHYVNIVRKKLTHLFLLANSEDPNLLPVLAIDDMSAVHFEDGKIVGRVSAWEKFSAFIVTLDKTTNELITQEIFPFTKLEE